LHNGAAGGVDGFNPIYRAACDSSARDNRNDKHQQNE
jgi:hypothetical protein